MGVDGSTTVQLLHEWVGGRAGLRWADAVVEVRADVRERSREKVHKSYDHEDYSEEVGEESSERKVSGSMSGRAISAVKVAEEGEFRSFFVRAGFGVVVKVKVEGEADGVGGSSWLRVRSVVMLVVVFGPWDGKGGSCVLRSQREGLAGEGWRGRRKRRRRRRSEAEEWREGWVRCEIDPPAQRSNC